MMGNVDVDKLNKGKNEEDKLQDTSLFANYVNWGVIKEDEADGGKTTLVKLGIVYDTRDNEPNPMKGLWTDAQVLISPKFLGDASFTRLAVTHRQYFTLVQKRLSFAYRLSYQAKLSGDMPYYMLPYVYNTAPNLTRDGLGGAKTIRGVLRNRVVGQDFAYGNFELRWKFLRTIVLNQNLYISLNAFTDMGMVTKNFEVDLTGVPEELKADFFSDEKESLHVSYGAGLRFALNENLWLLLITAGQLKKKTEVAGFI
ncbi:MAG: BamA/TamA family outer membrane protein [Bacteroidales bacterium]|nr:BamA/TamA family outer membrane protein [Bacteroidales bacterium]